VIRQTIGKSAYWVAVVSLLAAIGLMIGFMVINIGVPELRRAGVIGVTSTPAPSAVPDASPGASADVTMGGAIIPGDAVCAGCHVTTAGSIGLRPMPVIGHPLEGWGKCTDCHATARLVETAPGHSGIHASECTVCHKPGDLPAPLSRPHRDNQNVACLSCHGSTAPLPENMTHRSETVCWLCHRLPTIEPPVPAHETAPGEADCLTCHVASGTAGKLPADHVERPANLCLSCHEVTLGATPSSTPGIVTWPAPSETPAPLTTPIVPLAR
jgi:predicted CXXCH cytochrome family protein